jgi:hypothetical protein
MKTKLRTTTQNALGALFLFGVSLVSHGKTASVGSDATFFNITLVALHSDFLEFEDGGLVSSNQTICPDTAPADLVLTSYSGTILNWERSEDPSFTSPITLDNTTDILTGVAIGSLTTTTYFRAAVQTVDSTIVYSEYATITMNSTVWNGSSWSNGAPTICTSAIIQNNFTSNGTDITAFSLTVVNGADVIISSGDTVDLKGAINVSQDSSVSFESNANLIQSQDFIANTGAITIQRNSSALKRLDYTLWSSPVANQILTDFSPNTLTSRFYTYNTSTNLYTVIETPNTTAFDPAKGYLIRVPNNHPTSATVWTGSFTGVPNNGSYYSFLADSGPDQRYNLVGNPYPSPIDALAFVSSDNNTNNITGVLYFWRKGNNSTSPSYCVWSSLGFISNGEDGVTDPNGIIQTGQGFFVESLGNGSESSVNFSNDMRVSNTANQFFRTTTTVEKNRIWLNATNSTGSFSQMMLGYMTGATEGIDAKIDGKNINEGTIVLTSLIGDTEFAIQGRGLPFEASDVVPLSFSATAAGNYTIAIDHVDGLFTDGTQIIYLKDNLTSTYHNLNAGAYDFATTSGTFNNRFEIVYQTQLSNPIFTPNTVVIYSQNNEFVVNSGNAIMSSIKVFDIRGRLIEEQKGINANQTSIQGGLANQVLLVQITSEDGAVVTKKVIR